MLEGFMDEIAHQVGRILINSAVRCCCIRKPGVAGRARRRGGEGGWASQAGHALGIAAFEAFGSYICSVADVTVKDKAITCTRS